MTSITAIHHKFLNKFLRCCRSILLLLDPFTTCLSISSKSFPPMDNSCDRPQSTPLSRPPSIPILQFWFYRSGYRKQLSKTKDGSATNIQQLKRTPNDRPTESTSSPPPAPTIVNALVLLPLVTNLY